MDWLPKYDNPLDFVGTFLLIFGVFLVLAGFGVLTVEKISVKRGATTWILGILVSVVGFAFIAPHIMKNPVLPTATPEAASIPTSIQVPSVPVLPTSLSATPVPQAMPILSPTPDVQTPEGFLRYYFSLVTVSRDYQDAWGLLTTKFQNVSDPGGYSEYVDFWKMIKQVDVNNVEVTPVTSVSVNCLVDMTFHTMSGVPDNVTTTYLLTYNGKQKTWMFDHP